MGLPRPRARGFGDDADLIMVPDAPPQCSVCLVAQVEAMLRPCNHARFCAECAGAVVAAGTWCPVCRVAVRGWERIYV